MGNNARNGKPSVKVVIADNDDWHGLYIDGKLVKQDHRIEPKDVLKALGVEYYSLEVDGEWFAFGAGNTFPENIKNVQFNATPAEIKKATK